MASNIVEFKDIMACTSCLISDTHPLKFIKAYLSKLSALKNIISIEELKTCLT